MSLLLDHGQSTKGDPQQASGDNGIATNQDGDNDGFGGTIFGSLFNSGTGNANNNTTESFELRGSSRDGSILLSGSTSQLSDTQETLLAFAPILPCVLSVFGSCAIILQVLRKLKGRRRRGTNHIKHAILGTEIDALRLPRQNQGRVMPSSHMVEEESSNNDDDPTTSYSMTSTGRGGRDILEPVLDVPRRQQHTSSLTDSYGDGGFGASPPASQLFSIEQEETVPQAPLPSLASSLSAPTSALEFESELGRTTITTMVSQMEGEIQDEIGDDPRWSSNGANHRRTPTRLNDCDGHSRWNNNGDNRLDIITRMDPPSRIPSSMASTSYAESSLLASELGRTTITTTTSSINNDVHDDCSDADENDEEETRIDDHRWNGRFATSSDAAAAILPPSRMVSLNSSSSSSTTTES